MMFSEGTRERFERGGRSRRLGQGGAAQNLGKGECGKMSVLFTE